MIALLDNGQCLNTCEVEIGGPVGQLLTPLTRYRLRDPSRPWAIDNGGFKKLNVPGLLGLLRREESRRADCLFVAVPDALGSADETARLFAHWSPQLAGWRLALVIQDGQPDVPINWLSISAVFIGGSTEFKMSAYVVQLIRESKSRGKWVHVGRVNTPERFAHFQRAGADSCDGSGMARYSHMRFAIKEKRGQE